MKKEEKEILRHLIKKEMEAIKKDEASIEFPSPKFIKSADIYGRELKNLLEKLA